MKLFKVLAAAGLVLLYSCNSNTAEKKTTDDTVATTVTEPADRTAVATVDPPATIRTSFETKYPQATNVRWSYHRPDIYDVDWDLSGWTLMDSTDYVASYNWNGSDYWTWYDHEGNWIGTVNKVSDHSSLPKPVNNTISTDYKGYTIVSVDKENDKDRTAYEVELEGSTGKLKVLVDENGKIIKKKGADGDTKKDDK